MEKSKSLVKSSMKIFKNFDLFGAPIHFKVKGEDNYKSITGGFCGLFYAAVCILYAGKFFLDFAMRLDKALLYTNKIITPVSDLNFTDLKFTYAFSLVYGDSNQIIENDISDFFDIQAIHSTWEGFDATSVPILETIPLKNCVFEDIHKSGRVNITDAKFKEMSLDRSLCPDFTNFTNKLLRGLFTDFAYYSLELTVSIKPEKINEIKILEDKLLARPIKAYMIFIDTKFDVDDQYIPLAGYLNQVSFYINVNKVREANLKFSLLEFMTDSNILLKTEQKFYGMIFDTKVEDSFDIPDRINSNYLEKMNVISIIMECSSKMIIIERVYLKITQWIADMTGILGQVVLIIYLLMDHVNGKAVQQKIMHSVMKFTGKRNYNRDLFINIFEEKVKLSKEILVEKELGFKKNHLSTNNKFSSNNNLNFSFNYNINKQTPVSNNILDTKEDFHNFKYNENVNVNENVNGNGNEHDNINSPVIENKPQNNNFIDSFSNVDLDKLSNHKKIPYESKIKFDDKSLFNFSHRSASPLIINLSKIEKSDSGKNSNNLKKKELLTTQQLHMSSLEILLSICYCCNKKWQMNKEMIDKGDERVNFYLNILTYIKKLNEVDIMKHLLLTQDQLVLFNFLSSPTITTNEKTEVYQVFLEEKKKMILDKETISKLSKSYEKVLNSGKFSELDLKIIKMFNSEVDCLKD